IIRKSTQKAVILGMMDAMQSPNALDADPGDPAVAGADGVNDQKAEAPSGSPIALPRPQLIGIAVKPATDEPDRPGVPPKRVRMKRKGANDGEQPSETPASDTSEVEGAGP